MLPACHRHRSYVTLCEASFVAHSGRFPVLRPYRDFRANFTVTLCCEVNSGRKWEFQYQREIANGTYFHSCTGRARVRTTRAEQRRARVEQLCVGVEQRWQGLRSVTPSPHAAGAQRLTQLSERASKRRSEQASERASATE